MLLLCIIMYINIECLCVVEGGGGGGGGGGLCVWMCVYTRNKVLLFSA